jgi:predicted lipoprotein with Yx(FWY)xxD motif
MRHSRPITFLAGAAVIPLAALAVAACGGGGAAATASPPPASTPTTTPAQTTVVRVASTGLGRILVDSAGDTLYLFKADVGKNSACSAACATAWPPVLVNGKPAAGAGLTASKLGTITRSDGKRQVTYNGHPLYTFIKDKKPGEANGQGVTAFGAAWFAVSPAGNQISSQPKGHGTRSSSPRPAAPAPAPQPASPRAAKPTPQPTPPPPATKPAPPANNGIPQNGGGDDDSDNHGGPSDGDGDI